MSLTKTSCSLAFFAFCALVSGTACTANVLDLGANATGNGAGPLSVEGGVSVARAGCTEWFDDEVAASFANECAGSCTPFDTDRETFPTMRSFVVKSGGPWLWCSGRFGPTDSVGVEFAPGCRMYFLKYDTTGALTRGTEIRQQAAFGIFDPSPTPTARRIEVKTFDGTRTTYEITLTHCPKTMVLTEVDPLPGHAPTQIVLSTARLPNGELPGTFPK